MSSAPATAVSGAYDTLADNEIAIEASLACRHDGETILHPLVECVALEASKRSALARGTIDNLLEFFTTRRHRRRVAHYLHAACRMVDKIIQWQQGQNRFHGAHGVDPVEADQPLRHGNRGEVCIDHRNLVTVAHGTEHM